MPLQTIDLTSIGNTIVDLEYRVNNATLDDLKITKGSMTLIDQTQKDTLLTALGQPVHQSVGGSVGNSVYIASQLGMSTFHLGVIGNDQLGQFTKENYQSHGISEAFDSTTCVGDTACCLVLITPDGERTMLTYLGVSAQLKAGPHIEPIIVASKQLFIEGYLLADDTSYDFICNHIIPLAKQHKTAVALSASDAGLIGVFKDRFSTVLQLGMDRIFANLDEALALSGESSIESSVSFFRSLSQEALITAGNNGAYSITPDDITHHPTTAIQAVDTTGAGDAFAGTYLSYRTCNHDIRSACQAGHEVARVVVSKLGARPDGDLPVKTPKPI